MSLRLHFLLRQTSAAIRRGPWKLIPWMEDDRVELFELAQDPGE